MDEEDVTMMSREMETEIIRKVKKEDAEEMRTESSEELETEAEEEDTADKTPTCLRAGDPEAGPGVGVLKSATNKYCFLRDTSFNELRDEY